MSEEAPTLPFPTWPRELRGVLSVVFEEVLDELSRAVHRNAVNDYDLNPNLPSPEVFERPGWRAFVAAEGERKLRGPTERAWDGAAAEPDLPSWTVVPEIVRTATVKNDDLYGGSRWTVGIGFDVDERVWVVFWNRELA